MPNTATQKQTTEHRPLSQIANEINADLRKQASVSTKPDKFYAARPYLRAMMQMDQVTENFYADSGTSVLLYCLNNLQQWRGDVARRVKAELKDIIRSTGYPLK